MKYTIIVGLSWLVFSTSRGEQVLVPGTSNPYLAGMPAGTMASQGDIAPAQSPVQIQGLPVQGGFVYAAIQVSGFVNNDPPPGGPGPDGGTSHSHETGAEWSKSNITAPMNSLLGVFLAEGVPNGAPPPSLDFSTPQSRDYQWLEPMLNQIFFIGDGRTTAGAQQSFRAPVGATRLFLATMDGRQWANNSGEFAVQLLRLAAVTISGRVELSQYLGDVTAQPLLLELRYSGSALPMLVRLVSLMPDGRFQFVAPIPPATYDVAAKASHWLRRTISGVTVSSSMLIVDYTGERALVNGDIDGDNEIDIADVAILSWAYGSSAGGVNWLASSDLNGDLEIDIADYAILSSAFGTIGDP